MPTFGLDPNAQVLRFYQCSRPGRPDASGDRLLFERQPVEEQEDGSLASLGVSASGCWVHVEEDARGAGDSSVTHLMAEVAAASTPTRQLSAEEYAERGGAKFRQFRQKNQSQGDSKLCVGDRVCIPSKGRIEGVVKFIGSVHFAPGDFVGVLLDSPLGKNDGSVECAKTGVTKRYFDAQANYGTFLRANALEPVSAAAAAAPTVDTTAAAACTTGAQEEKENFSSNLSVPDDNEDEEEI